MRVSVDPSDPGYRRNLQTEQVRVWLDDKEVKYVITADSDEGFILRYCADPDGRLVIIGDEVAREVVLGRVRIDMPPYVPPDRGAAPVAGTR